jgi:hypothetical protein
MRLRLHFILAALALAASTTNATAQGGRVNLGHSAAKDIAVRLVGPFARLKVTGWAHDSVALVGWIPPTFKLDNAFAGDPGVPSRGAKFYIDGEGVVTMKTASLELFVPAAARVWIKGGTSDVTVTGVTGDLDLNMLGGTIVVDGKPTALNVEAIDANVHFSGTSDWLRLKTDAGDIAMAGQSADAAFTTVSGNVRVIGATLDRARFESMTGSLTFAGELLRNASLQFDSHSGAIDVQLGGKPSAVIQVVTLAGMIENLLTSKRAMAGRNGRGQELEFDVGQGNGRIRITTYKGNVRIAGR